ncbi:MAG: hypothetical protein NUV98_06755 [Candidatus Roizmanbacteria bacterium]|nr:hypothetical protein [Candidatus Roizmanbacteria bacterium]
MIKRIIWVGIILAIVLYTVPKLIERLSLFVDEMNTDTDNETNEDAALLFAPIIDSVPTATNSARISISGFAENAQRVEIFVNDISKKNVQVRESNSSFSTDVPLYEGENSITIVAMDEKDNKSQPSSPIVVSYIADGPELILDSPEDNQEVKGNNGIVVVRGLTDTAADITINGRWVLVKDDGSFSYEYRLSEGDNEIKIVAEDSAGNKSETTRHVRYSK